MEITKAQKYFFTDRLTGWHEMVNHRELPWKNETDPYRIWLSEIILQQTRAQQGIPYYLKFTGAYPTIQDMAAASDEEAYRIWQGLGYYNRCRNMLATARYVVQELSGIFPATYEGLLGLKGVGPYTAAAIASFAFGLPEAVVDGNVYRVLSRYFAIETAYDTTVGKKLFAALAGELLPVKSSAAYNQAIMDLGATVCTPRNPACDACPLAAMCQAFKLGLTDQFPVKSKKVKVRTRHFHYFILKWEDAIWMHKRTGKDIWANLFEPYLVEGGQQMSHEELLALPVFRREIKYDKVDYAGSGSQKLTHQLIVSHFYNLRLVKRPELSEMDGLWLTREDLGKTALPKTVLSFLENNLYF